MVTTTDARDLIACFVLLVRVFVTIADEECTSSGIGVHGTVGDAMLQVRSQRLRQCELPEGASWCTVRLVNLEPFQIAAYQLKPDVVSKRVCQDGSWEVNDTSDFGAPGHLLDIGGNIGYYAFAFAQAGWNVTTFEPMAPNLALINASLCQNPNLASRIRVNPFALGIRSDNCKMFSGNTNVGDGHTKCTEDPPLDNVIVDADHDYVEVGSFAVRRLDEILVEQSITNVDVVKIDVEGYEFQVLAGAPTFIEQYQPRLVKSEVWTNMTGATGVEYLAKFESAGYQVFADSKCTIPMDAQSQFLSKSSIDVNICKRAMPGFVSKAAQNH